MRIRSLLLLTAFLFFVPLAQAQLQNHQWRFGFGAGLNFLTNPVSYVPAVISAPEGSASIADRNTGALLFYTDGLTVWNRNNQVMLNGTGLLGGSILLQSSTSAAVIAPRPGSATQFYIVTIDEQDSNNGLRYSLVDMTLDGGLGGIVAGQKNVVLDASLRSEKLQTVPNNLNNGLWIVTKDNPGNGFYAFELLATGFSTIPVVSIVGGQHGNGAGHMRFNRQMTKIAMGNFFDRTIEMFDFNRATGQFTNPLIWNGRAVSTFPYGIEFSPDGSKLYVSNLNDVIQYDLSSGIPATISASATVLSTLDGASMQLGPDHKIYINSGTIDRINCPDELGTAANYQANLFPTQGVGGYGLPMWVYYATDQPYNPIVKAITASDSCLSSATQFALRDSAKLISVSWNFGDPTSGLSNTATGFTPSHVFSAPGLYTVTAQLVGECINRPLTFQWLVIDCNLSLPGTVVIQGDSCLINEALTFSVNGGGSAPLFSWDFGDPAGGSSNQQQQVAGAAAPQHRFSAPGIYRVCVQYQQPGRAVQNLCRTITVGGCCRFDLIQLGDCFEEDVTVSLRSNYPTDSVFWSFGDTSSSGPGSGTGDRSTYRYSAPGSYPITARVYAPCGADTLSLSAEIRQCSRESCLVNIPNAFSPNNDGLNESFSPVFSCEPLVYRLRIYNRWGQLLYHTDRLDQAWNGEFQGHRVADGVYYYQTDYQFSLGAMRQQSGAVRLIY